MTSGLGSAGIVQIDIPPGGLPGYVLTKLTINDYDMSWQPGGGGGGGAPTNAFYFLSVADALLPNGRIPIDTATVTWDLTVANQFKANIAPGAIQPILVEMGDGADGEMGPPGLSITGPAGPAGADGIPGATIFLEPDAGADGDPGPPGIGLPGATGAQGPTGPAVFLEAEAIEGEMGPPGPPGAGSNGATGAQGPIGPAYFAEDGLDGEMGPPGVGTPGAAGATGAQGPVGPAVFLEAEQGEEGPVGPPGSIGTNGTTGAQGPVGPAVFLEAEPGEEGPAGPPGTIGTNGTTGAQGPAGPAVFLEAEPGDDGLMGPPGPQGPAGGGGGGGGSATTVEVNLGATAVTRGKFTITDASITAASKVLCWQAPGPYTGKGTRADEAEMQPVQVIAVEPAAGSAVVKWETPFALAPLWNSIMSGGPLPAAAQGQKDPQGIIRSMLRHVGKVRGNVKFSYTVFA